MLLYSLGEDVDDVLTSMNISEDGGKNFAEVLAKFEAFFKVRQNIIFERAKFNKRTQLDGESAKQYITTLYHLAEMCNYPQDLKSDMIQDRLVVGIRDQHLSQQLQMDPELTLEKAKIRIRQKEAISQQQDILKDKLGVPLANDLELVRYKCLSSRGEPFVRNCTQCGKGKHSRDKCPARDVTCYKCRKRGHHGSVCFSKKTTTDTVELQEDPTCPTGDIEEEDNDNFLGAITTQHQMKWIM